MRCSCAAYWTEAHDLVGPAEEVFLLDQLVGEPSPIFYRALFLANADLYIPFGVKGANEIVITVLEGAHGVHITNMRENISKHKQGT